MVHSTLLRFPAVLIAITGMAGCFAEPDTEGSGGSSSTGGASSGPSGSVTTADASSGTDPTSESQTTDETTGNVGTTGTTGFFGTSSSGFAEDESSTGRTRPEPMPLCPEWVDEFEGGILPVWELVWPESIQQSDGQTHITLTAETADQYPRRVVPWQALGVPPSATIRYRVTPATLPTQMGTQLNTIFEGPDGYDVTLALNYTGSLEFRLTSRANGTETVWEEESAVFPPGASVQFEIGGGEAAVSVIDSKSNVLLAFDPVPLPFGAEEGRLGFAANNWAELGADAELAVESFDLECESEP